MKFKSHGILPGLFYNILKLPPHAGTFSDNDWHLNVASQRAND
jgi:hypothetical protein